MTRFSVSTKIFLGFALVILSFGGASVYSILKMRTLGDNLRFIREGVLPVRDALKGLDSDLKGFADALGRRRAVDLEWSRSFLPKLRPFERLDSIRRRIDDVALRGHLKSRDRSLLLGLAAELEQLGAGRTVVTSLRRGSALPSVAALLADPEAVADDRSLYDVLGRAFAQRVAEGNLDDAYEIQAALRRLVGRVERRLVELSREFTRAVDAAATEVERDEDNAILAVIVSSTAALIISLLALFLSHITLRPIRHLTEGARRISEGDYDHRVRVGTRDEIGQLAAEFNAMTVSLMERDRMLAQQREALLRSERLATIGRMAAQITHEIRNPLSSIGLNVEMLEEEFSALRDDTTDAAEKTAVDEAASLLRAITEEVDRLRDVTDEYLRYARLPKARRAPGNLGNVLQELLQFVAEELQTKGITVDAELAPLPETLLDAQQMRQAFLNIIRNAAEAMPDGGQLRVTTRREGAFVVASLADTGQGIAAEDIDKVLDPFFSTKRTGTGIGLALTHQIVTEHDGTLELESTVGEGTTVAVRLPVTSV